MVNGTNTNSAKKYVITSIQAIQDYGNAGKFGGKRDSTKGAPHKKLIRGIEKYCDDNNAELILLTMNGMNAVETDLHDYFVQNFSDKILRPDDRNIKLNKNCIIADYIVPPQNMDPATSIDRLVQNDQTTIFAHSKQRFKSIAAGNARWPKLLLTTGAITHPNYNESNKRGLMATKEHTYGFVVAEILNDKAFNVRLVRAQKNGNFIDLANIYQGTSKIKTKARVDALVLGDIHLGDHDEKTMAANIEMISYFKPKRLFIHDLVNGHSVNPHERKDLVKRVQAYELGRLSIEEELKMDFKYLNHLGKKYPTMEINIVFSNHGFFIDRYLESGVYINEPWNSRIAHKLALAMIDGKNPVEEGIRMMGKLPSNINFLKLREDYKVWGCQFASHGHKGISGARGSVRSREVSYGKSVSGHTHAPEIQRNTYIVGTSTKLDLPYTDGSASRWLAANAVQYEGGLIQLLPIIKGKWNAF